MQNPSLATHERAAVAAATRFAEEVVADAAARWEVEREFPMDALRQAANAGLTGLLVPQDLGGQGLSCAALALVLEAIASEDLACAFSLVVHNNLMGAIAANGSSEQRERFLPALANMDKLGAFLLTEPNAGSDAAAIETRAHADGGTWVINGRKAWITNATHAQTLSVYAQTDPTAGWRGIAAFVVDADARGVLREPRYEMLGGHALGAGGFRFEDVRVAEADMLVPPGRGFKAAMAGIDIARAGVAVMCCAMLQKSLDIALAYTHERQAFGGPIANQQGLQWQLADVATDLHAARLMAFEATRCIDAGDGAALAAAHAKKFATRVALTGISDCMQAMGANGLKHTYPLARHLAGAKIAQYLDGTTEIQNVVISRALAKRVGA